MRNIVVTAIAVLTLAAFGCERVHPPPPPVRPSWTIPPAPTTTVAARQAPHYDAPPLIRVWLSDAPAEPTISCDGPCRLQPREGEPVALRSLPPSKVKLISGGFAIGAREFQTMALDIVPESGTFTVERLQYGGSLRIIRGSSTPALINSLDIESYLLGVLGSEMPPYWELDALKAQAVAARTYALYSAQGRAAAEWDLMNDTNDQVYSGGAVPARVREAVQTTRGEALLHDLALFPAFFHSTCGGQTEPPGRALGRTEFDFLEGVACPYCAASPYLTWRVRLDAGDLSRKLSAAGIAVQGPVTLLEAPEPPDGVERSIRIGWKGGEAMMRMVAFRQATGPMTVRSGRIDVRAESGVFLLMGRGLGHGAGMCQYGARGMAQAGKSYREILAYYYRNTALFSLY